MFVALVFEKQEMVVISRHSVIQISVFGVSGEHHPMLRQNPWNLCFDLFWSMTEDQTKKRNIALSNMTTVGILQHR